MTYRCEGFNSVEINTFSACMVQACCLQISLWPPSVVKRSLNLWVAAFAALSVFGTEQINLDGGVRVPFLNEVTEIGSQGNFDGQNYTCPITANYFIYYRLVMDFFGDPPCGIDLVVGGERQVN